MLKYMICRCRQGDEIFFQETTLTHKSKASTLPTFSTFSKCNLLSFTPSPSPAKAINQLLVEGRSLQQTMKLIRKPKDQKNFPNVNCCSSFFNQCCICTYNSSNFNPFFPPSFRLLIFFANASIIKYAGFTLIENQTQIRP
jgi:hypothetical protein